MTTTATQEKLDALIGANDLSAAEIKLVLKHWDEVPKKLHTGVINSVKVLDKIPPSLQVSLIESSEKAASAIGELLCVEAQDLIIAEYADDLPILFRKALLLTHISESLWKKLAAAVKSGALTLAKAKKLAKRDDCPPQFVKAAGIEVKAPKAEKAPRVKRAAREEADDDYEDDEFEAPRKIAKTVKSVKRPRS